MVCVCLPLPTPCSTTTTTTTIERSVSNCFYCSDVGFLSLPPTMLPSSPLSSSSVLLLLLMFALLDSAFAFLMRLRNRGTISYYTQKPPKSISYSAEWEKNEHKERERPLERTSELIKWTSNDEMMCGITWAKGRSVCAVKRNIFFLLVKFIPSYSSSLAAYMFMFVYSGMYEFSIMFFVFFSLALQFGFGAFVLHSLFFGYARFAIVFCYSQTKFSSVFCGWQDILQLLCVCILSS